MAPTLELREGSDGLNLTGYACVVETPYEVGEFTETITRNAFKRTLKEGPDVVLLVNHQGLPLARTKTGTLTLSEDNVGLRFQAQLDANDPDVQSLAPKMRRGDVSQCSFAFVAVDQSWNADYTQRTIKAVSLNGGDVSIVTNPANPATSATLRTRSLTLEQRKARALQVGRRVSGLIDTGSLGLVRANGSECVRCGGTGEISMRCPNCEEGAIGTEGVAEYVPPGSRAASYVHTSIERPVPGDLRARYARLKLAVEAADGLHRLRAQEREIDEMWATLRKREGR